MERSEHLAIANTKDPALYRNERYGMTSFSYPVPNGKYVVKLHFAETYNTITGPGERVFTFIVEGQEFKDFDVWAAAGGAQRACVETVNVEVTDGKLNISFIPQQENPEINGIEILPATPVLPAPAVPPVPPVTPATPVPLTPPAPPVPTVPPATTATETLPPLKTTGTPSEPYAHQEKFISNLSTTDPFREAFSRTLPLSANGRLRLDNVNGRVEIIGSDRSDVVIKALKHGKTQESVEATKINVAASPDEIAIHTEQPPSETGFSAIWSWLKNGGNNDATVDYAIQVPRHARLTNISSVNGRVVIDDVSGDIAASTVNGEMQVRDAAGSLKLSAVNGRIAAELASLGGGQSVSLNGVNGRH